MSETRDKCKHGVRLDAGLKCLSCYLDHSQAELANLKAERDTLAAQVAEQALGLRCADADVTRLEAQVATLTAEVEELRVAEEFSAAEVERLTRQYQEATAAHWGIELDAVQARAEAAEARVRELDEVADALGYAVANHGAIAQLQAAEARVTALEAALRQIAGVVYSQGDVESGEPDALAEHVAIARAAIAATKEPA